MKKTQVFSVAALALVLGVAAPIAVVTNPVDTYAIANDSVSSQINDAIDQAMMTRINGEGATAYDYATLRNQITAAGAATIDQTNRLIDQLIIEDGTTAEDYAGLSVQNLIDIARNRTGYEGASMAALQSVVNNAENNIIWHRNQIRNTLFDKFNQDVDSINTLDQAIVAAEATPSYGLYCQLLDQIDNLRALNGTDANLREVADAIDALFVTTKAIDQSRVPVNPIDPIEPEESTNPTTPDAPKDDQTSEGGMGSASDDAELAVAQLNTSKIATPNTGVVSDLATANQHVRASSSLAILSGIAAACAAIIAVIARAARRNA